jgi:hypothetical protein
MLLRPCGMTTKNTNVDEYIVVGACFVLHFTSDEVEKYIAAGRATVRDINLR